MGAAGCVVLYAHCSQAMFLCQSVYAGALDRAYSWHNMSGLFVKPSFKECTWCNVTNSPTYISQKGGSSYAWIAFLWCKSSGLSLPENKPSIEFFAGGVEEEQAFPNHKWERN